MAEHFLDNRGLQPPEPMVKTIEKLEAAAVGDVVIIHNDKTPLFLIEELKERGFPFEIEDQADGSAIVRITKTS